MKDYADLEKRLRYAAKLEPLQGFLCGDGNGALMRLPLMLEGAADAIAELTKQAEEARMQVAFCIGHIEHYGNRDFLEGKDERGDDLLQIAAELRAHPRVANCLSSADGDKGSEG